MMERIYLKNIDFTNIKIRIKSFVCLIRAWLMYTSITRVVNAIGYTFCVYKTLNLTQNNLVFALVFALTYIMYTYDYVKNSSQVDDQVNMKDRSDWISQHSRQLIASVIVAVVISLFLITMIPEALPPILLGIAPALGYTLKFLPEGKSPKQLPGVKAFYVAALWTVLIVWIPYSVAGSAWTQKAVLVALICFCSIVSKVNLSDIRDIEGDKLVGTMTLPVLVGARNAKLISLILAIVVGSISVWIDSIPFVILATYLVILVTTYNPTIKRIHFHIPVGGVGGIAALVLY
jgi:4-hydroxybenzoate polyprenyltransferase